MDEKEAAAEVVALLGREVPAAAVIDTGPRRITPPGTSVTGGWMNGWMDEGADGWIDR